MNKTLSMPNYSTRSITELKNYWDDEDIWLIAAGKSLDYVDPDFFSNKLTLGLNRSFRRFPHLDYLVIRDFPLFQDAYDFCLSSGTTLIAAEQGFDGPDVRIPCRPLRNSPPLNFYTFDVSYP